MFKLSGVTIDYYDDRGETLKKIFPTLDSVPEVIKTASVPQDETVPAELFALTLMDQGHVMHKFACVDAGTTAMSVIYFMEHGDKLPEDAQKVAATNLTRSCLQYGLLPPVALVKMAEDQIPGGVADGKPNSDFSKEQLDMGKKVEMEHTNDPAKATEISRDHLEEFPDYYTRLNKMEAEAKKEAALKDWFSPGKSSKEQQEAALAYAREQRAKGVKGYEYIDEGDKPKKASVVNITGKAAKPIVKKASAKSAADYAVVLPDGTRHYPIHTWNMVKKAEVYFQEEQIRMEPEIRRQFAKNLTKKAHALGYPLDPDIAGLGAARYNSPGHLKQALEMRKIACAPGGAREFLDGLYEKRASVNPEVYAECLRRFDVDQGLDRGWDRIIPDPWFSTFGISKVAEVIWEDAADRVTEEALKNLAANKLSLVQTQFTNIMANEFRKDPVGIFNSMPVPQKKLLARMANDSASSGGSENYLVG